MKKEEVKEKVGEMKEKVEEVKDKLKEKLKEPKETKTLKPLVTSRLLFISVLDKIFIIILIMMLIGGTYAICTMSVYSSYFWETIVAEIGLLIIVFISYLFLNWLYKCAAKTMLCLTKNEVYKESYAPFKKSETSIPLDKITGVTTYNVFWIFRTIIIHQYSKLPLVFFTWNNKEFKDNLNELITTDKNKIENEYEDKNIIPKKYYKYLKYVVIILIALMALIEIIKFIGYTFSDERKIPGTYSNNENVIELYEDSECNIDDIKENVLSCSWTYNEETKQVYVSYSYRYYYSYYYGSTIKYDNLYLEFNSNDQTLTYQNNIYTK